MTLQSNASLREVFDEFERIKNSVRIIGRGEIARDTAQFPTKELAVYPQKGYVNNQSEIKVPLNLLQKSEPNLKAENIKSNVNIFGITGNLKEVSKRRKARLYAIGSDANNRSYGIELDFNTGAILTKTKIGFGSIWAISMQPKFVLHQNVGRRINVLDSRFTLLKENIYIYPQESISHFSTIINKGTDRVFAPKANSEFNEYNPTNYAIIGAIKLKDTNISARKLVGKEINGKLRLFVLDMTNFNKSIHEINPDNYTTINAKPLHINSNYSDIDLYVDPNDGKLKIYVICMHELFIYDANTLQEIKKLVSRDTISLNNICVGYEEELIYDGTVYVAQ